MSPKLWYIRGLPLFDGAQEIADRLRQVGRVERWGHRAEVGHREDPGEVQVVLAGNVELVDGQYGALTRLTPGDVFGDAGGDGTSCVLRAYDDLMIASLSRDAFEAETLGHLGKLEANVGIARRRLLSVPVASLLYTTPRRRVAGVLVYVMETLGTIEADRGVLDFRPKPRSLARLSGLADPTVSDIVDGFKRSRIVEVGRTQLVIPSLDQIRELTLG